MTVRQLTNQALTPRLAPWLTTDWPRAAAGVIA